MYITVCTALQVKQKTAAKENAACYMTPSSAASRSSVLDYLGLRSFAKPPFFPVNTAYISKN
jgi:hypothetical protein